jgi:uroporphyrinogen-III synthase
MQQVISILQLRWASVSQQNFWQAVHENTQNWLNKQPFTMKVIVTRPHLEADVWVKQLRTLNFDAIALPLIHIKAPADNDSVKRAWKSFHQYSAVMFVSSNAVRYFYSLNMPLAGESIAYTAIKSIVNLNEISSYPKLPRMWATGLGTRDALLAQLVPSDLIDAPAADAAQFDSETLWQHVKNQIKLGDKVLIVRGSSSTTKDAERFGGVKNVRMNGRPWLADQLTAAGVQVDIVVSYERSAPKFDAAELMLMENAVTDQCVWLLSSSEAVANLSLISNLDWSQAIAIATHPRIARAAKEAGFGVVYESRPLLAEVAASIESLL